MALERTLSIIKPDAVAKNVIGEIYSRFEKAGLKIIAAKMKYLSREEAEGFYAVHRERRILSCPRRFHDFGAGDDPGARRRQRDRANRELMGATDPENAAAGTIRADFADSIDANAVHGSDSAENASAEIAFFFATKNYVLAGERACSTAPCIADI